MRAPPGVKAVGVGTDFQVGHHEIHQGVPTGKHEIAREGAQILEESLAVGQTGAGEPVVRVGEGQESMIEESQDVAGGQEGGEVFLAMAEVVFEGIALGFEGVVVWLALGREPPGPRSPQCDPPVARAGLPGGRAEQQTSQGVAPPVPHQVLQVLADTIALQWRKPKMRTAVSN